MKYYCHEYEHYVDEQEVKRQYNFFRQYSWFTKTYEQFRDDNFSIMRYSEEEEEE